MTHTHLPADLLSDVVDGLASGPSERRVEEHLEQCAGCRAEFELLRATQARARALPREVAPPDVVWAGVRAAVTRRTRGGRGAGAAIRAWRALATTERAWIAAAAVLVAVASAGLTAVAMRGEPDLHAPLPVPVFAPETTASQPMILPASVREVERNLAPAVAALERTLAARRNAMLPRTAATIEHSLSVINQAIQEARAACVNDSTNAALVDALSRGYEQKIDLLKRATELAPRT